MKKKIFWWIAGFLFYSVASLLVVGFLFLLSIAGAFLANQTRETLDSWLKLPFCMWVLGSQWLLASLVITAVIRKFEEILLRESSIFRWIFFSG